MNILNYEYFEKLNLAYKDPSRLMHKKMRIVLDYVKQGESLIDIGCGTGEFIFQLRKRFDKVVGIDTSSHAIEFAGRRVGEDKGISLECGELDSFQFPSEDFDVCLCLDVLEHVRSVYPLVKEIFRILRPDGEIIVTVPNWYDIITTRILRRRSFHVHTMTPWNWMGLLKRAGFRIRFYRAVEFPLVKSDFLARKIPILGMCIFIVAIKKGC